MTPSPSARLLALEALAIKAGDAILEVYGKEDFQVSSKNDSSPLTAADMASHKVIEAGLQELTPDIPILSEESASISWETRQSWTRYWLVDPLDGTKEFIKRNGEFTVNIALIEDHVPTIGMVYMPTERITWMGHKGTGAWKRVNGGDLSLMEAPKASDPLTVAVSRSHPSEALQRFLADFAGAQTRALGSSLKFCRIAEGEIDLYPRLGPTSEWDTAAAQAVLEAAGGMVVYEDGTPLRYNTKDSYLNPFFHALADADLLPRVIEASRKAQA